MVLRSRAPKTATCAWQMQQDSIAGREEVARTNWTNLQSVRSSSAADIEAAKAEYLEARQEYFASKFHLTAPVPPYEAQDGVLFVSKWRLAAQVLRACQLLGVWRNGRSHPSRSTKP